MRLFSVTILLLLFLLPYSLTAQRRHHIWYFGQRAGMDFNQHPPEALTDSRLDAVEGTAAISDSATGALLFYTDGETVWDRMHRRMPNGTGLQGGVSSTQAALIFPMPGDSLRYVIASTADFNATPQSGLYYSVVDMRLNGGFGDITTKGVQLVGSVAEKVTGVPHCNGRDYWIITHDLNSDAFYAFLLNASGVVATPVVSRTGAAHVGNGIGWLVSSTDGRRLASVARNVAAEIFSFDPCSGVVSQPITLPAMLNSYGVAFSPDNSKLYIDENRDLEERIRLWQFDLASNDPATIPAAGRVVFEQKVRGWGISAMRLAPDGRIYVARCCSRSTLGVINHPDALGVACDYRDSAFALADREYMFGLPNFIDALPRIPYAEFLISDTVICEGSCVQLFDSSRNAPTRWRWVAPGSVAGLPEDVRSGVICFDSAGLQPITLVVTNAAGVDSVTQYVNVRPAPRISGPDIVAACGDTSATLDMSVTGGTPPYTYFWSPAIALSATDVRMPIASPSIPVDYTLTAVDANGCSGSATVHVEPGTKVELAAQTTATGELELAEAATEKSTCRSVQITNHGLAPLVIDGDLLAHNRAFSIPPSQLPFVVAPGEERALEICYHPTTVAVERDTLRFGRRCSVELPLLAHGLPSLMTGDDMCGTGMILRRDAGDDIGLKVSAPHPNPATVAVEFDITISTASTGDSPVGRARLLDIYGNVVGVATYRAGASITDGEISYQQGRVSVSVAELPSGTYFADIHAGGEHVVVPVIVRR
jgi:PKD repeat protein